MELLEHWTDRANQLNVHDNLWVLGYLHEGETEYFLNI